MSWQSGELDWTDHAIQLVKLNILKRRTRIRNLSSGYLACSKRSAPPPSLLLFRAPFYFAPLPTIWTPGTGYWILGIGVFIILWDLPFPFEGQSVGSRKKVRSSNYPTNCSWVSEDGSSWVLLEDRSDHYIVHHPSFQTVTYKFTHSSL